MISAVLFDLDDTLFPQADWLAGAWEAVSLAAVPFGADPVRLRRSLEDVAAEGSARGRIIDRALIAAGLPEVPVPPLVDAFLSHRPPRLRPYDGVPQALERLRRVVPIGLVSDGAVGAQVAKLRALGLDRSFDAVVFSDALGRQFRKPDPLPFRTALDHLHVTAAGAVFVGDHPEKDIRGAVKSGMRAIRVRTGEYARLEALDAWLVAEDVVEAVDALLATAEVAPHRS